MSHSASDPDLALERITAVIHDTIEATRTQDLERFMSTVPGSFVMTTPSGDTVSRDELRDAIAQQWSIIIKVIEISITIDNFQLVHDGALLQTSQKFHRLIKTRDGLSYNDVITTQFHEEHWKQFADGWCCVSIKELGGKIFVDGAEYQP